MEHVSRRPVSKDTHEYVRWLITWMWSQCIDTKTREVLQEERKRIDDLYAGM
ncbi:MAG TPA: hypothetical protein VK982_04475 [Bacteroidales bacterium]|nr:hypothetical protein [Bacteroidales bacterium]